MDPAAIRHDPEELVPLAEGARRLGLAHDTARKHLAAGMLRGEKRAGRWWVWAPAAVPDMSGTSSGTGPASSGMHPAAAMARLESEVAFLRTELEARTEEIRRRDHIIAALVEQVRAIPATVDVESAPRTQNLPPLRHDPPPEPL